MSRSTWLQVLSRICPQAPVDLDSTLAVPPWPDSPVPALPVSSRLWSRAPDIAAIGIRVTEAPADPTPIALRLAAAAAERGVIPVILSSLPQTGFERFGLRVERLPDGPPDLRAAIEAELQAFWDMPIVIDLDDVAMLG